MGFLSDIAKNIGPGLVNAAGTFAATGNPYAAGAAGLYSAYNASKQDQADDRGTALADFRDRRDYQREVKFQNENTMAAIALQQAQQQAGEAAIAGQQGQFDADQEKEQAAREQEAQLQVAFGEIGDLTSAAQLAEAEAKRKGTSAEGQLAAAARHKGVGGNVGRTSSAGRQALASGIGRGFDRARQVTSMQAGLGAYGDQSRDARDRGDELVAQGGQVRAFMDSQDKIGRASGRMGQLSAAALSDSANGKYRNALEQARLNNFYQPDLDVTFKPKTNLLVEALPILGAYASHKGYGTV